MITAKLLLASILEFTTIFGMSVDTSKIDPEQAYCLAENIYYESRSEDLRGQFAVGSVTLNRVNDARFPSTVCDVVRQSKVNRETKKVTCAFTWYCENDRKGKDILIKNEKVEEQFKVASLVAIQLLSGNAKDNTRGATHFHNPYTSQPAWKYEMTKTMTLGNHDFYK
jgi:spore germination cell wall hydrolase CwlJ-like protein